ncbi:MAG: acyl-CoA desaturase [Mycobacteriales bacterium]
MSSTMLSTPPATSVRSPTAPPTLYEPGRRPGWEQVALWVFVVGPVLALAVGIVLAARGHGITWLDLVLAVAFYAISGHGVTVGFHRLLTHGSFKARPALRVALAVAGSLSVQGPVIRWVADHRRHHAFSDAEGDPHSPWRFGTSPRAVARGLWWAHTGWLFDRERTSVERFAPDLAAEPAMRRVHALFPLWAAVSVFGPALVAYAVTGGSSRAAWSALIWAGLVRILVLHHVTWSINSICHVAGARPYASRDRAGNVWWLAVISMGESWHNLHHAEPTSARHGADRGQLDSSAALIRGFERLGWASDVRWPDRDRLARKRVAGA